MKKEGKGIGVVILVILCLMGAEMLDGKWKENTLQKVVTVIFEDSFLVSGLQGEERWLQLVMGKRLYFQPINSDQRMKSHLVYMENNQQETAEEEIQSSGESSAVMGESLVQVPEVKPVISETVGTAEYVKRLWENKDVNYLWNHFYIIDSTTSVKKNLFPVEKMLTRNLTLPSQAGKKQILIYHTHGASETFSDSKKNKESDSIIGVGTTLAQELEKQGYQVYHDKTKYDLIDGKIDRSQAYNTSLAGVERILKENPDIQVTIDLHRDAVGKGKHTYSLIDGKKTAIVMFFNGMSRTKSGKIEYLNNPNLEANLSFSLQLKCHAMELFDGFTKPIYLKGYRYNLHIKERALLIELGNENNTVQEAKNAAEPLAKVIADVLKGEVNHK
nr:stage II sporulation protein P [Eubacterium sp.]